MYKRVRHRSFTNHVFSFTVKECNHDDYSGLFYDEIDDRRYTDEGRFLFNARCQCGCLFKEMKPKFRVWKCVNADKPDNKDGWLCEHALCLVCYSEKQKVWEDSNQTTRRTRSKTT